MNTTFKIRLFLLVLTFLFTQCEKEELGENEESETTDEIKDVNFLKALIENGVDVDEDGVISTIEAENVAYLDVSHYERSDMSGISMFVYLKTLICSYNQLTTLDVSNNIFLEELFCVAN